MIGNKPDGCQWQPGGWGFVGGVDEVSVFRRALSQTEIQAIGDSGSRQVQIGPGLSE